ncbi:MAG TPA: 2-hydroxychromene-2-carboxylate isomerase [Candidatus Cybelea sp.]|nr:2-hydroxychromene-2-carboxylate isomerase [Candidatus Cybelea sp.]
MVGESGQKPIEFWFDFSSPYGYLASYRIDEIGREFGREVVWRPYLLGVAFKNTGQKPLVEQPLRGPYSLHDMQRSARKLQVPLILPDVFPMATIAASRAYYWAEDRSVRLAKDLAKALYRAAFAQGRNIAPIEAVVAIAWEMGIDGAELEAGIGNPVVKERLRKETDAAITRGIFGSPFVIVDDEPFWGNDRLDEVHEWLKTGGW